MMVQKAIAAAWLFAVCATSAQAQTPAEPLMIKRPTELREAPLEVARSLAALPALSQVTRLGARQGPWIEVRTAQGLAGWVHMFDAGTGVPSQAGSTTTGALRGLTSFFGKGTAQPATTTATSTIGIRGLGAEDISNAQPNLEAVARAEALRQDAGQARQFGSSAALMAQTVSPLPAPAPAARGTAAPAGTPAGAKTSGSDR